MANTIHDAEWHAKRKELMQRYHIWKTWRKQRVTELKASLIENYKGENEMRRECKINCVK